MTTELLLGSLSLSLLHAAIPNHWLPIIAIGKRHGWTSAQTTRVTLLAGMAHAFSTILIGIIVGLAGWQLTGVATQLMEIAAPLLLIVLGAVFIWRHYYHRHFHLHGTVREQWPDNRLIFALTVAMFFSPCLEISAFFLLAGSHGWLPVLQLSMLYAVTTVGGMVVWVRLVWHGLSLSNWHALEHYAGIISGMVLLLAGLWGLFHGH